MYTQRESTMKNYLRPAAGFTDSLYLYYIFSPEPVFENEIFFCNGLENQSRRVKNALSVISCYILSPQVIFMLRLNNNSDKQLYQ